MKKILAVALLIVMIFSFIACNSEQNNEHITGNAEDTESTSTNSITNSPETEKTPQTPTEILTPEPTPDDYFVFGKYEQDGDLNNGAEPIEWIILKDEKSKLLLVSRYILDYQDFNDTTLAKATSWGNSTLRKWLNNEFYNSAFSSAEQNKIITTKIQDYKADNALGDVTSDKVFILNKEQAFSYFASDYDRATTSTDYARTRKSYVTDAYWLINSYSSDLYKHLINSKGRNENNPRVNESQGIRPVVWINK